jgi:hypothetical protein
LKSFLSKDTPLDVSNQIEDMIVKSGLPIDLLERASETSVRLLPSRAPSALTERDRLTIQMRRTEERREDPRVSLMKNNVV